MSGPIADELAGRRLGGVVLVLLGFTAFSTGGVILRFIETHDGWAILFWRSVPWALSIAVALAWRDRASPIRALRRAGPVAFGVGACVTGAAVGYIFAVQHTTVANVVFTFSATPFVTAVLGLLLLREPVASRTWAAIAAALAGIALMVGDGLGQGSWLGNLLALGASLSFAMMLILLRWAGQADTLPGAMWGGLISIAVGALLAEDLALSTSDLAWCAVFGTVNMSLGLALLTMGARHIRAAETALLGLAESVLAPIWVWLAVGEQPSALTLAGGTIVVAAVAIQALGAVVGGRRLSPARG